MKSIGVLTSGGDAPGLNACIRSVVRACAYHGVRCVGIHDGFEGLIAGSFEDLDAEYVTDLIRRGGTVLKSTRSERFSTPHGRALAFEQLTRQDVDGLVVLGGDGSFRGARAFLTEHAVPLVAVPKTIDNDVAGTDFSIGYDTACNTAMEAMDRIRDTAESHNKIFFVEVMGRDAGFIAFRSGLSVGAEAIYIPETHNDLDHLYSLIESNRIGRRHSILVVVAEGDEGGGAAQLAKDVTARYPHYDARVSVLGHIQRGGSPSCADRVLASKLGVAAVNALLEGKSDVMVGEIAGATRVSPLSQGIKRRLDITNDLSFLLRVLSD
ncbi:MAG: ATP-dependent 6-phosphofructokinase [Candidatus Kapaibacterium sp.]